MSRKETRKGKKASSASGKRMKIWIDKTVKRGQKREKVRMLKQEIDMLEKWVRKGEESSRKYRRRSAVATKLLAFVSVASVIYVLSGCGDNGSVVKSADKSSPVTAVLPEYVPVDDVVCTEMKSGVIFSVAIKPSRWEWNRPKEDATAAVVNNLGLWKAAHPHALVKSMKHSVELGIHTLTVELEPMAPVSTPEKKTSGDEMIKPGKEYDAQG